MIKLFIYPIVAAKVAAEMVAESTRTEVRQALHKILVDTLSDAEEINDLKAEIAVLRSELSEVKYQRSQAKREKVGIG